MVATWRFWRVRPALAFLALAWLLSGSADSQQQSFNEREVKSQSSVLDKADVWCFDFRFKDPRLIKVHVPGKGTRIYWYLWYQIVNRTGDAQKFVPEFELVTLDFPGAHSDEVSPAVQDAIKRLEDPSGYQDIKNSVTISSAAVPVTKDGAFPLAVTGVAIWDASAADPAKKDPKIKDLTDSTRFSIFVRGLSNGFVTVDSVGDEPVTRYKTLQLNFKRQGNGLDARDLSFVGPAEWIYRAGRERPAVKDAKDGKKATTE